MARIRLTVVPAALPMWEDHGKRYVHCSGGRAGGKTVAVAQRLVMHALKEPDLRILVVRHTEKDTKESIKEEIERCIDDMGVRGGFERKMSKEIRCRNGAKMVFLGLQDDPRAVKGFARSRVVFVEEGDQLTDAEWRYLDPTIRAEGAVIYIAMNPTLESDALWYPFKETEDEALPEPWLADSTLHLEFNWKDLEGLKGPDGKEMLSPEYVRSTIQPMYRSNPQMAEHVYGGGLAVNADALVFKKGVHWKESNGGDVPVHALRRYGLDFAGLHSPAVGIRCRVWGDRVHVEKESWRKMGSDVDCRRILDDIVDRPGAEVFVDWNMLLSGGNARRGGYQVRYATKGGDSVLAGVRWLRSRSVTVDPSCRMLIGQLRTWSFKVDRGGAVKLPEEPRKDGKDAVDALRYALDREISGRGGRRAPAWLRKAG